MGHVNPAVYFTYFAEARLSFFQRIAESTDFSSFSFILAHIRCDFLKPVMRNSRLLLELVVEDIGKKSFRLGYQLVDYSDPPVTYATGASVQVFYDYEKNMPVVISASLKRKLTTYRT